MGMATIDTSDGDTSGYPLPFCRGYFVDHWCEMNSNSFDIGDLKKYKTKIRRKNVFHSHKFKTVVLTWIYDYRKEVIAAIASLCSTSGILFRYVGNRAVEGRSRSPKGVLYLGSIDIDELTGLIPAANKGINLLEEIIMSPGWMHTDLK